MAHNVPRKIIKDLIKTTGAVRDVIHAGPIEDSLCLFYIYVEIEYVN